MPESPDVTIPVVGFTEAMVVDPDDQLPVVGVLLSVVTKPPSHTASGPVIAVGSGLTVTTAVPVRERMQPPIVAPESEYV